MIDCLERLVLRAINMISLCISNTQDSEIETVF